MPLDLSMRLWRAIWTPVRLESYRQTSRWLRAVRRGPETQAALFRRILDLTAGSAFARDFGLDRVRSIDDLRAAMPVAGFERSAPYSERVQQGETEALFAPGTPIHMFALTSGTTGTPKMIPVTDPSLKAYRRGWLVWGAVTLGDNRRAFGAKFLQLASRADEETTPCGLPAGAMSGLTAQAQRRSVRWLYAVPPEVVYAGDTESKYYLACRLGLLNRRLSPITANPSTLLGLARMMDGHREELLRDIADGTLKEDGLSLGRPYRERIEQELRPAPGRVRELETVIRDTGHLYPKDVWDLPVIGAWKGGTLSLYLRDVRRYWGGGPIRDIGLIASEGRFSIPLRNQGSAGLLEVTGTVYEFMPESEAGKEDPETLLPHEVDIGGRYFLVLTTPGGLFRYDIRDLVEVTGRAGPVPAIRFLNKGEHTSNLTGEKITEFQVVSAVNAAVADLGLDVHSYCLCPTWDEVPYYSLLVEETEVPAQSAPKLAVAVERALAALNIEYQQKRASRRLQPIRVKTLADGTWQEFDREAIRNRRGRAEQYKHKFLATDVEFEQPFDVLATYEPPAEKTAP